MNFEGISILIHLLEQGRFLTWHIVGDLYVFINLIHFHNGQRNCFKFFDKLNQSNFVIASKWIKVFLKWLKVDQTHFHLVISSFLSLLCWTIFIKMYRSPNWSTFEIGEKYLEPVSNHFLVNWIKMIYGHFSSDFRSFREWIILYDSYGFSLNEEHLPQ